MWKIENVPKEEDDLAKEISGQSAEGATGFFQLFVTTCMKRAIHFRKKC